MNEQNNKKIMTDEELRKEAISNYTFYIGTLSDEALAAESKRIANEAEDANILLHVPDFDDYNDNLMEQRR